MKIYEDESREDELERLRSRQKRRKAGGGRSTEPSRNTQKVSVRPRHNRRPSGKKSRIWLFFLIAAVLAAGAVFVRGRTQQDGYWTVAIFGVDSRDGKTGKGALSDVEMIASINRKTGEIRLASVFRDSYLQINSEGSYDKINEAYFLGGHEQATDAFRMNFDLPVDDYATFNWKAVADAINVLGGIDLEITDKEFSYINSFITETVNSTGIGSVQLTQAGMNHLDGVQAVAYARLRLMDTDFNRTERQRKVLGLAMEKAKQANFKTLKTLVGAVYPQISTSIGVDDILSMAKNADRYYIGQTSGFPFSHTEMKVGKKSCVIPTTLESNVIQLHAYLYDNTSYQPSASVQEISSHIAKKTGLGEPGKDTESGKNIGAQGNTGGGQSIPAQTAAEQPKTEAEPQETEVVQQETETMQQETETMQQEQESYEAQEAVPGEAEESGPDASAGQETISSHEENVGPAFSGPGAPQKPSENSPTVTTGSGKNTLEAPGKHQETETETKAALEGPGQESARSGNSYPNEFGPGRTE